MDHPVWGESNAALQAGSAMLGSLARLEMICRRMVVVVSTNPDGDKAKIKKLRQRGEPETVLHVPTPPNLNCSPPARTRPTPLFN